ncbi:MAG: cysteine peptidase family C39 domain-containing protein [Acidimicrobiaceae bacterium]|uniref:cysteine peptidase family C39 domain-containing protein n=1 Tax=Candidatus Poriferisodalis multihospitum TaxID=2983191 RepID=UPI0023A2B4D1|nr:cysteine peptidase family C39 domain-containing protein [Candidatus Poriferisodalis multihospitum]MDE0135548.1 cysteine peptidase family C39 domain-containing protein [Acidimicrobiaceae bacterium]MDE0318538.1 cysteine peptidase family C39 domain-containing protein [Acidimicrobiaceae bacterium]MDE0497347.1 cysteine peptidase family C39 domain-containing protein [Acidimicrobiaceae bacterium]
MARSPLGPRRIRSTPVMPQLHATECGAACLGIVLSHHGRTVPIEQLRAACRVTRDGSSAADLVAAGRSYGLKLTGWRMETDGLARLDSPAILFWEFNHFVVLEGMRRGRYFLNDPANGRHSVSEETIDRAFTGVVLTAEREADWQGGRKPPGIVRKLWPWLGPAKGALVFSVLAGLLATAPVAALPILLGLFVDSVLSGAAPGWGTPLSWALAAAGGLMYVLVWLQQYMFRKLAVALAVSGAEGFLGRLFRLPPQFFDHRFAGDLTSRVHLVDAVAGGAATGAAWIAIELISSLVLVAVMLAFDPLLAALASAVAVANVALTWALSRRRTDTERQLRHEQATMAGIEAAGLRDMETIRATASEGDFFVRWSGQQARELAARQRFAELGYVIGAMPRLFTMIGAIIVLGIGGWQVATGDLSAGSLIAFYTLAAAFMAPIGRFVLFADAFMLLDADLQRVQDVLDAPEDPLAPRDEAEAPDGRGGPVATFAGRLRLAGKVELQGVTFGFHPERPPLIHDLSLTVEPGQRVALVGPTGSGKSTLLRLIGGQIEPDSGEILFDGAPRSTIPREVLAASLASVDQQIHLFAASVRDNLAMWNTAIGDDQLIAAARDARIHDVIMDRAGGFDAMVAEGGKNFSGGQRQRLEIARALALDPAVLLADEATSTLDVVVEQEIDDALRRRGMTCILAAHRLATIRDCDEIVVLQRGRSVQRGTHDELAADRDGLYFSLVASQ